MEEVKALLVQAWIKAKENGVIVERVNFDIHESASDAALAAVEIDAKLK